MSKIILAQIDTVAGDINQNSEKIKKYIQEANNLYAQMVIFPEVALFGFPYGDINIRHKSLIDFQMAQLSEIAKMTATTTVLVGFLSERAEHSLAVLNNGKIVKVITTPDIIDVNNDKYGVIIGDYNQNNASDVMDGFVAENVKTIIHTSVSMSRAGKEFKKNKHLSEIAKKYSLNYIYVNQAGYGDNSAFDGASRIYNSSGELTALAKSFDEDFMVTENFQGRIEKLPVNVDKYANNAFSFDYENDMGRIYKALLCGIKGYFKKTGFKKAVLGLSGGLDSSVCAVLLADALGKENVYAISMPTKITSTGSKNDANELVKNLGINFIETPIVPEVSVFTTELEKIFQNIGADKYTNSTTFENIQARTRATLLWSISNECKSMLTIATSDKSEAYIGYATTNGDMSGGFAPIADVTKTKLFALADFLNKNRHEKNVIPISILEKPPGAELKFDKEKGRTITAEEDNMPYPFLDEIIWYVENKNWGYRELIEHEFLYEKENPISFEQKENWIMKFFDKAQKAVFKWHILPLSIIVDSNSINSMEYYHPIISTHVVK